jgi:monovalent cation/hydrogen antiporter
VFGVHYAIVLVLGGLALGFVPGISAPRVQPNIILFVFLPPLIYAAAFGSSTQDLRANARSIGLLAVGLVIATIAGVALVAHVVAGIGWGPAVILGAVLRPTDPVVATSVLRRLGAPDRISTVLEGESLVNDGTGLTIYKLAVTAVASGGLLARLRSGAPRGGAGRGWNRRGRSMGLGADPPPNQRAADRGEHLAAYRVPGLYPG